MPLVSAYAFCVPTRSIMLSYNLAAKVCMNCLQNRVPRGGFQFYQCVVLPKK
ncbi:hypothetical protein DM01DRAFT_1335361, partial [Hesseltinella vesiculosa]